jgi:hypothetical protein
MIQDVSKFKRAIYRVGNNPELVDMPEADAVKLGNDPSKLTLVCVAMRPNWSTFVHALEYRHFHPGTKRNDDFEFLIIEWAAGPPMFAASVPLDKKNLVEKVAKEFHLALKDSIPAHIGKSSMATLTAIPKSALAVPHWEPMVRSLLMRAGVPEILINGPITLFPMKGPTVFTIENVADGPRMTDAEEDAACRRITKENEWRYGTDN